jgi:hypothetical protein
MLCNNNNNNLYACCHRIIEKVFGKIIFNEAYVGASYGDFGLTYYKGNGEKTLEAGDYIEGSYDLDTMPIIVFLTCFSSLFPYLNIFM